eukprot:gene7870-9346_t
MPKGAGWLVEGGGGGRHREQKLFTLDPVWNETCRLYVRDIDSQLRIQKLFTLDPVWNETCRLYVRDIDSQLRIQLYDQDLIGSDDDLGVAFISVKSKGPNA